MKMNETVLMDCKQIEKLAWDYFEENLPPHEHEFIESHLAECASCINVFQQTELVIHLIEQQKSLESSPFISTRILNRLEGRNRPTWKPSSILKPAWQVAVVCIVIVTGVLTGNKISTRILSSDDFAEINNTDMHYADQSFITDADYYTPGFEYLNE